MNPGSRYSSRDRDDMRVGFRIALVEDKRRKGVITDVGAKGWLRIQLDPFRSEGVTSMKLRRNDIVRVNSDGRQKQEEEEEEEEEDDDDEDDEDDEEKEDEDEEEEEEEEEGEDDRRKPPEPIDEEPSGDSDPEFPYRRGTIVRLTGTTKAFRGYGKIATVLTRPLENGWMDVRQLIGGERSSARQTEMEVST
jgi:hypothetical protein